MKKRSRKGREHRRERRKKKETNKFQAKNNIDTKIRYIFLAIGEQSYEMGKRGQWEKGEGPILIRGDNGLDKAVRTTDRKVE